MARSRTRAKAGSAQTALSTEPGWTELAPHHLVELVQPARGGDTDFASGNDAEEREKPGTQEGNCLDGGCLIRLGVDEDAALREAAEGSGLSARLVEKACTLDIPGRGRPPQHYWFAESDSMDFGAMSGPERFTPSNSYRRLWVPLSAVATLGLRPTELRDVILRKRR